MREGSFFVSVKRQSAVESLFPFLRVGSASLSHRFDVLASKAERSCTKADAGVAATVEPLSFKFPGAVGLALQATHEAAGGLAQRKQPAVYADGDAAIIFSGALHNLDELQEAGAWDGAHSALKLQHAGDQALLSAQVILRMYRSAAADTANLPSLLAEIQGRYSFVLYDSGRRAVFAARDPSGREPLFTREEDDGCLALTNAPGARWGHAAARWQEVQPGHFLAGGRHPEQQLFALSPQQLAERERAASLEEMSPLQMRALRLGGPLEEEREPSSTRSSTSCDRNLFRISV